MNRRGFFSRLAGAVGAAVFVQPSTYTFTAQNLGTDQTERYISTGDGSYYVFKGNGVYRLTPNSGPKKISHDL